MTRRKTPKRTLAEVLSMVPDLVPLHILNLWSSRGKGIRVLRLVSKEVGSIALRSVTSCAVTLGEWTESDHEELGFLIRGAHLNSLQLNMETFPGKPMVKLC